MFLKILGEIDIIGSKFHFYQGKTPKRKTIFGGLLTIILIISIIILIITFGNNFFTRKNPSVTLSIENDLKYEFIDLKEEKIFFAFRIEDYDGNYINESDILFFKIYYYTTEERDGVYRKKIHDEYLSYHICNESDYEDFGLGKNLGVLYCPELGGKKFGGYWDSPNLYYFEIQVFFCENGTQFSSNNTKCTSLEKLKSFLNQDNPKFFAFYYPLIEFNPLSYSNPILKRYKNYYYILSHRLQRNDDVFLKKTILADDKGWLFNSYKNFSDWGIDSFRTTYAYYSDDDLTNEGASTKIYELNLYSSLEKNYYTRYYMKIQNVIAVVGSLINLIFYIFQLLSSFIGDKILKLEIIQSYFELDDKKSSNKFFYRRSNTYLGKSNTLNAFDYVDSNLINIKIDTCKNNKNSMNFHSSLFTHKDNIFNFSHVNNKVISISKQKKNGNNENVNNILNDTKKNSNIFLSNNKHFIFKNIDKVSNEQSGNYLLQKIKTQHFENIKPSAFLINNSKMRSEKIKMYIFFFCYNKKLYTKIFKNKDSNIIHWFYIHLMQADRYLEMNKQFDFLKKLLLNEGQICSLEFLKKIDLNNEDEKDLLMSIKENKYEKIVISYFRSIIKSGNFSQTDSFIFDNLSDKIKKCIL